MARTTKRVRFTGNLLMLGFGSIGQAVLPVLFQVLDMKPAQVKIVKRSDKATEVANEYGVAVITQEVTQENHEPLLEGLLKEGDFLLNLSVDVSSLALLQFCWKRGVLYLDTCNEPWPGRYDNPELTPSQRSNYSLREEMLAFRADKRNGPTAVVTQGANPGLVSSLLKQALLNVAADMGYKAGKPSSREEWAGLSQQLGIKAIHIAERDFQTSRRRKKPGEFVNTWSVDGFVDDGLQPAELGWGSHEKHWPADASRHGYGCDAAIFLNRPGLATRVRSWTPLEGPYHGFLVTHAESISIADYLSLRENGATAYRPTVHYAYHPCDDAVLSLHEVAGKNWELQAERRILRDDISEGVDELGVLLMGASAGSYWYGSRLSIDVARELAPYNSATSLQVVAGILGGMVWAIRNPAAGVVEPNELNHEAVLEIAIPYLGEVVGIYSDWTPLRGRSTLFSEDTDEEDAWQFLNFRVN
jgi:homospermidine synthase